MVDTTPRRLHPASLVARWLKSAPQAIAGTVALTFGISQRGAGLVLLIIGAALLIGFAFTVLAWWRFRYTVGADEIVIEKGLLQRERRVIPFDRVQDLAIEQKLVARLFGTAKVKIETGGSGADEGVLDMIGLDEARALRDHIKRRGAAAPAAAVEAEAAPAEPVLFAMDLPRVLLAGIFGFSLVFLALIGGLLQYLDQFGIIEWDELFTRERADQAAGFATIQTGLSAAAFVLLAGLGAGIARTLARDFGFRLTRAEAGLRRRRGLFTLTDVVIPLRRTQVALIESGPIARLFGWHALSFQTLGADRKEGGVQVAAPFARMEELLPILAEAGFPVAPPRSDFHGVPRRALIRRTLPFLALAAVTAVAALAIERWIGAAAVTLLLVVVPGAILRWRKHSYFVGEQALFVSTGVLRRRIWIVPFQKTQTISVSRGPLQRALRLGSVLVDTAGASPMRAPEIVDMDSRDAERLAERLLALFYPARAAARLQHG